MTTRITGITGMLLLVALPLASAAVSYPDSPADAHFLPPFPSASIPGPASDMVDILETTLSFTDGSLEIGLRVADLSPTGNLGYAGQLIYVVQVQAVNSTQATPGALRVDFSFLTQQPSISGISWRFTWLADPADADGTEVDGIAYVEEDRLVATVPIEFLPRGDFSLGEFATHAQYSAEDVTVLDDSVAPGLVLPSQAGSAPTASNSTEPGLSSPSTEVAPVPPLAALACVVALLLRGRRLLGSDEPREGSP